MPCDRKVFGITPRFAPPTSLFLCRSTTWLQAAQVAFRGVIPVVTLAVGALPLLAQMGPEQTQMPNSSGQASASSSGVSAAAAVPPTAIPLPVLRSSDSSEEEGEQGSAAEGGGSSRSTYRTRSAAERPVAPPLPIKLSEFEFFVRDTIGYALPVFGRDLFSGSSSRFQPATVVAPADYVLGPGDTLRIRAVGKVDIDVRARVDAAGQVFIPQVGLVTVAGSRADQVTEVVRRAVSQQFKSFDLTVTLGQLRSIQIFVLGQARSPGTYTVSALSTLVNALFVSGGPDGSGSMRDVQLIRNGQTIAHFDVYRFLLDGNKTADQHLLAGDILYIPPIGPQAAVAGDVDTPAIYELRGPTSVEEALAFAAGLSPVAGTARATLDRVTDHQRRSVLNFPLDAAGRATLLQNGDIFRVLPVSPKIDDAVTLRGPAAAPGRYAWHAGMRVTDLVPTRESLLTRDYYNRRNDLDLPHRIAPALSSGASFPTSAPDAKAGSNSTVTGDATMVAGRSVPGAGNQFSSAANATEDERSLATEPAVTQHDNDINWNYATIERINPQDLKVQLLPFNLGQAIDQPASAENLQLLAGDVVVLYSSRDLALPLELTTKFVRIDGQVNAPGVYQLTGVETLRDLVRRAGGLAPHAYLYAAQLTRESVRVNEDRKLQQLLQRESASALSPSNVYVPKTGGDGAAGELALRRAYLAELGRVHSTGRVVLGLQPTARTAEDVPEFALEDADHFFVPSLPNTVNVLGSVYNPGALRYVDHGRVKRYLNAAGGPEREADQSRMFILRADGTLLSKGHVSYFDRQPLYPGDAVVVPANLRSRRQPLDLLDLTALIGSLALTAAAVRNLN